MPTPDYLTLARDLCHPPRTYTENDVAERERAAFYKGALWAELRVSPEHGYDPFRFPSDASNAAAEIYPRG